MDIFSFFSIGNPFNLKLGYTLPYSGIEKTPKYHLNWMICITIL
jgi:hypothetical protein